MNFAVIHYLLMTLLSNLLIKGVSSKRDTVRPAASDQVACFSSKAPQTLQAGLTYTRQGLKLLLVPALIWSRLNCLRKYVAAVHTTDSFQGAFVS